MSIELTTSINTREHNTFVKVLVTSVNYLCGIFAVVWTVLGSLWLFEDGTCEDGKVYLEFFWGWLLTLIILIYYYGLLAGTICAVSYDCASNFYSN